MTIFFFAPKMAHGDLTELAQSFGLPAPVITVLKEKAVTSISMLVKTFEDDEQFFGAI